MLRLFTIDIRLCYSKLMKVYRNDYLRVFHTVAVVMLFTWLFALNNSYTFTPVANSISANRYAISTAKTPSIIGSLRVTFNNYVLTETNILSEFAEELTDAEVTVIGGTYPNPNPADPDKDTVQIGYRLNKDANIEICIYNMNVQLVKRIPCLSSFPGGQRGYNKVNFNGLDLAGNKLGNGIYVYLLVHNNKAIVKGKIGVKRR